MSVELQGFREVGYGPFPIQVSIAVDAVAGLFGVGVLWGGRWMARSLRRRTSIVTRFSAVVGPTAS